MYIKDLQSGKVREYGTDCHDSLRISSDGRMLTYYNLQNGDGSGCGDYRFCDENGNLPCDIPFSEGYFNIGGFDKVVRCDRNVLQAMVYIEVYVNRILWKLNKLNNERSLDEQEKTDNT